MKPVAAGIGGVEGWDSLFLDPPPPPPPMDGSEHSFVRWFMPDFNSGARIEVGGMGVQIVDPRFGLAPMAGIGGDGPLIHMLPPSPNFSPYYAFADSSLKPQPSPNPTFLKNENQQVPSSPNHSYSHLDNSMPQPNLDPNPIPFQLPNGALWQQQSVVDQLFEAAGLVESGNTKSAQRILARLNHQLPSPFGKPLIRSAFYFKEALLAVSTGSRDQCRCPIPTLLDIPLKLSAYKAFAEISPVLQFTSFTSTQAILEELSGASSIHVIDFDVGIGSHWPALIQELSQRPSAITGAPLSLRITAFVSMSSYHPLELRLIQDNLAHFAANLNAPFELNFLPLESFDPVAISSSAQPSGEAIAVNLTNCFGNHHLSTQVLLRLIKQLSPKIVVSANLCFERFDFSFSRHFLHSLQSTAILLESIEASGAPPETVDKIERYLLRHRIECSVNGYYQTGANPLPWGTLLASVGFVPIQFSNFAESQADCLLKKVQVRGFQVEKRHSSLMLSWQLGEIALVSAWRCR